MSGKEDAGREKNDRPQSAPRIEFPLLTSSHLFPPTPNFPPPSSLGRTFETFLLSSASGEICLAEGSSTKARRSPLCVSSYPLLSLCQRHRKRGGEERSAEETLISTNLQEGGAGAGSGREQAALEGRQLKIHLPGPTHPVPPTPTPITKIKMPKESRTSAGKKERNGATLFPTKKYF